MYKSAYVHLLNSYPDCLVKPTEDTLDVFAPDGSHLVALRKTGAGTWEDLSEEYGCEHRFDLAPIPKHSRWKKIAANGKITDAEEWRTRFPKAQAHAKSGRDGYKVPSLFDLAVTQIRSEQDKTNPQTEESIRDQAKSLCASPSFQDKFNDRAEAPGSSKASK